MDYKPTWHDAFEYFVEILEKDEELFYQITNKFENQLSLKDPRATHEELADIFEDMLQWDAEFVCMDMKAAIKKFAA
jgi:hypothetical protein